MIYWEVMRDCLPILLDRDKACVWCGREANGKFGGWTMEHILPSSRGGTSGIANLALACSSCNSTRKSHPAADYAIKIARRNGEPNFILLFTVLERLVQEGTAKEQEYATKQLKRLKDWSEQYERWGMC